MARMRGYAAAAAPGRWTVDCVSYIAWQLLMFSDVGPATAQLLLGPSSLHSRATPMIVTPVPPPPQYPPDDC